MFVFGQIGCICQKWLFSVKLVVFGQKIVVFRQVGCILAKLVVVGQIGCNRGN